MLTLTLPSHPWVGGNRRDGSGASPGTPHDPGPGPRRRPTAGRVTRCGVVDGYAELVGQAVVHLVEASSRRAACRRTRASRRRSPGSAPGSGRRGRPGTGSGITGWSVGVAVGVDVGSLGRGRRRSARTGRLEVGLARRARWSGVGRRLAGGLAGGRGRWVARSASRSGSSRDAACRSADGCGAVGAWWRPADRGRSGVVVVASTVVKTLLSRSDVRDGHHPRDVRLAVVVAQQGGPGTRPASTRSPPPAQR